MVLQPNPGSTLATIRDAARLHEPDRYTSALLAPRMARDDLITLAAYLGEVRRVPLSLSDATLGEIRLQWWRDTLSAGAQGGLSGNPIADEMVRVIARHSLPLDLVLAPLDAASAEVAGAPFDDEAQWTAYLDAAEGSAMTLSALCLGISKAAQRPPALVSAGRAYAACRMALRLPELLARGRWPVPPSVAAFGDPAHSLETEARALMRRAGGALSEQAAQYLGQARSSLRAAPSGLTAALLPAALVTAYGKALSRRSRDALREPAQIAPLTRILRLWRASATGRI
jgi:15-cis-phytoene synthase